MATVFACFRPTPILSSASSSSSSSNNHRKHDPNSRKAASSSSSSSVNWWTPLFGWPSDPDYINNPAATTTTNDNNSNNKNNNETVNEISTVAESQTGSSRSRFALGCFTEEKAKQLRRKTLETVSFHDIMYHSAIASRLASDVSDRQDI